MSNIRCLRIENFKGIGKVVEFNFKPITLLFGQNSSGKSTVLHSLNYLNDLLNFHAINADGTQLGVGSMDLGGFEQFVHQHDLEKSVGLGLDIDGTDIDLVESDAAMSYRELFEVRQTDDEYRRVYDLSEVTSDINRLSIDLKVSWSDSLNRPYVKKLEISFNEEAFAVLTASSDCRRIEITKLYLAHSIFESSDVDDRGMLSLFEGVIEDRYLERDGSSLIGLANAADALPEFNKPLKLGEIWSGEDWEDNDKKAEFRGMLATLLLGSLEFAASELQQLRYLGPIREIPGRDYKPRKAEGYNWANGLSAWDALFHEHESLLASVNHWLHGENAEHTSLMAGYTVKISEYKQLPIASRLVGLLQSELGSESRQEARQLLDELVSEKHIVLWDEKRQIAVYPEDVGIGISQLLPVIVAALSRKANLLSIEQPELHVHPRMQAAVGDLLIESAMEKRKTFLLETHSEHLMLRLLRRIRENADKGDPTITQDDIGVVYVDCVDGETRLIPIRIASDGKFVDRWPKGFFAERAEELF